MLSPQFSMFLEVIGAVLLAASLLAAGPMYAGAATQAGLERKLADADATTDALDVRGYVSWGSASLMAFAGQAVLVREHHDLHQGLFAAPVEIRQRQPPNATGVADQAPADLQ